MDTSNLDEINNLIYDYNLFYELFDIDQFKHNTESVIKNLFLTREKHNFNDLKNSYLNSNYAFNKDMKSANIYVNSVNEHIKVFDYDLRSKRNENKKQLFINNLQLIIDVFELFEYIHRAQENNVVGIQKKVDILKYKLVKLQDLILDLRSKDNMFTEPLMKKFKNKYIYFLGNFRIKYIKSPSHINDFYKECESYEMYINEKTSLSDVLNFILGSINSFIGEYRLYTISDVYEKSVKNERINYKITFIGDAEYVFGQKEILTNKDDIFNEITAKLAQFLALSGKPNDQIELIKELVEIEKQVNTKFINKHGKLLKNMKFNVDVSDVLVDKLDLEYLNGIEEKTPDFNQVLTKLRLLRTITDQEIDTFAGLLDIPTSSKKA